MGKGETTEADRMTVASLAFAPIVAAPFGVSSSVDLRRPLGEQAIEELRAVYREHKLLLFTGQKLTRAEQERAVGHLGPILPVSDDVPEISVDGSLGTTALAFHSDFIFTAEPIRTLSLHAIDVEEGKTVTRFAHGIRALDRLSPELRARVAKLRAVAFMAFDQSRRAVPCPIPDFLPQHEEDAIMAHPVTGEPILYLTEMQTAEFVGMPADESEILLQQIFAALYPAEGIYDHRWQPGDLLIWDNLALQHGRPSLDGVERRRLQRCSIARRSFVELHPDFDVRDPRIRQLAAGLTMMMA